MRLLLVRHGKAGDREEWLNLGNSDFDRPLTEKGKDEMKAIAKKLRAMVTGFEKVIASPFVRTVQTGEILAKEFETQFEKVNCLAYTAGFKAAVDWIEKLNENDSYILVGHEPTLGQLVEALLTGRTKGFLEFKKGGAALLNCDGRPAPGRFGLEWIVTPKHLLE